MRALISREPGGVETLELAELPVPRPGHGQLRVRVLACGINYPDVLIIEDRYQLKPQRPFAPGAEVSGVVEELGEGVQGWKVGDRLIAVIGYGGLAEQVLIPASSAIALPEDRDAVEGAALLMTYATALHALVDRGGLGAGEVLLVLGAAGGVGLAAIEIGKALQATVIAAVSDETKAEAARQAGADKCIVYGKPPFDRQSARALTDQFKGAVGPQGANVIFDPVGGEYCEPALRSIGWAGRYLVIGFPAGIPSLPLNLALLKGCDIRGVFWGAFVAREPEANRAGIERLFTWWRDGLIRPKVLRTWPLEEGGAAIAWLGERRAMGKAVVRISV